MRKFILSAVALASALSMVACGSSSSKNNNTQPKASTAEVQAAAQAGTLDCDAFMQDYADICFNIAVYEEDGVTLRNDVDENGNILGPVNQGWAADYCACFAETAFKNFGCTAVAADESLDSEAWKQKYAGVRDACVEASIAKYEQFMESAGEGTEETTESSPETTDSANTEVAE